MFVEHGIILLLFYTIYYTIGIFLLKGWSLVLDDTLFEDKNSFMVFRDIGAIAL